MTATRTEFRAAADIGFLLNFSGYAHRADLTDLRDRATVTGPGQDAACRDWCRQALMGAVPADVTGMELHLISQLAAGWST